MRISAFHHLLASAFLVILAGTPALADERPATTVEKPGPLAFDDKALDRLFADLRQTRDPDDARLIADQIRIRFRTSDSATLTMLMDLADKAAESSDFAAALDFIDQVVVLDPSYAEAWNRRATFHYLAGNTKKSMADIAEVLKREPRHIGALAAMAGILDETGRKPQALKVWERYLALYPADRDAQKKAIDISEAMAGQKT
jgi:tetratricopeptide (TPR) repeat protein